MNATAQPVPSYSLSKRLSLIIIVATASIWVLSLIFIYWQMQRTANQIFDQSLAETAHSLLSTSLSTLDTGNIKQTAIEKIDDEHFHNIVFQLWNKNGQLIYRSVGVEQQPFIQSNGFSWINMNGDVYRGYAVWDSQHQVQVQIAQLWKIRQQIQYSSLLFLLMMLVVFLPLLSWLIIYIVNKNLSAVHRISESLEKQSVEHLRPIQHAVPNEIMPMVNSLNSLLLEIADSIDREKRFTSNAAHELRTPLSAIRVHAQVLQNARSPQEAEDSIRDIILGVDKASRMITQLLTFARLSANSTQENNPIDLSKLIQNALDTMAFKLQQASVVIECHLESALISGQIDQIEILIRNLLENALSYRRKDSLPRIKISCGRNADTAFMQIEDNGIGIAATELPFIFQRFYRINQSSSVIGSGLGLSIVKQIVEQHQAHIEVFPAAQTGVVFKISFALL
ncbi:two-component system sensor histidine kinase QseC [Acinetobacter calcoaceticus]|uniref:histidine kinase n=1 Tax=Acinetobacter calcoaceticus TaxID=471 RepID=A0A4R1XGR5_ACICA|nr:two-component system sensor histidine kinase QseC [Acinetobacter calcoaceticus]